MSDAERLAALEDEIRRLRAVCEAYEQWEGDVILDQVAWRGGLAELPTLTYPLWDRLLEIQAMRNEVLGRFADTRGGA